MMPLRPDSVREEGRCTQVCAVTAWGPAPSTTSCAASTSTSPTRSPSSPDSSPTRRSIAAATSCSITLYRDEAGAAESNELAAEWVRENLGEFELERTEVIGGEVMVSRAASEVLEPAHH